ncbi:MAG: hypothetical protein Satyrvirus5_18 [Satyrvirus sp.]|uniref:C2H2-type domain-containing protein n=1 Tax=Satyrvirus sp. TaxID=2487771 RepID=A0A3G5AH12_9VIRU|nr:MAG: hypothetical protein Satyrvirus5_18 [Satyrvirus sp.]
MTEYICKKCKQNFTTKRNLQRHKNNLFDCVTGSKSKRKRISFKCQFCNMKYTRKDTLQKHLKKCKYVTKKNNKINNKTINKNSNNKTSNNTNNKNSNNNSNNSNNKNSNNKNYYNISLIVFAKDGIKSISPKDLADILKSNCNLFESMISNVNLNPNKPQHHNICYTDIKSSYGEVYEDKKWVKKKIDEILDILLDAKIEDLNEIVNEMGDFLSKKAREKIKNAIENMDYSKPGYRKNLKSYLKPILYNHKDMIIKTRKLTKKQEE